MPRIASLLGALTLVVGSIGWNMARWPIVWEMTAAQDDAPQPAETPQADDSPPAAGSRPEATPAPAASNTAQAAAPLGTTAEAAVPHGDAAAGDSSPGATAAAAEEPLAQYRRERQTAAPQSENNLSKPWPAEVAPAGRYAAAARFESPGRRSPDRELVPVNLSAASGKTVNLDLGHGVRRLPPVEQASPAATHGGALAVTPGKKPSDAVATPAYLSTGLN
jgi:hypothetical protein